MSTYTERRALVDSDTFRRKLQMAIWIAAVDVINNSGAPAAQQQWAKKNLKGNSDTDALLRCAIRASANQAIGDAGEAASDADIQFVVNGLVPELSA